MIVIVNNQRIDITDYVIHVIYKFKGSNTVKLVLNRKLEYELIDCLFYTPNQTEYIIKAVEIR